MPDCLHSSATEKKLEYHKKLYENKDITILAFNQYQKSYKTQFTINGDLESIKEKIDVCKKNSENSPTTTVSKHIP